MTAQPHRRPGAAECAAARSTTVDQLRRVIDALDELLRDMQLGTPSQGQFDGFEARGRRAAEDLVVAFRGSSARQAPALWVEHGRDGKTRAIF